MSKITIILPSLKRVAPIKVIYELITSLTEHEIKLISLSKVDADDYSEDIKRLPNVEIIKNGNIFNIINDSEVTICNGIRPNFFLPLIKLYNKRSISFCHSVEDVDFIKSRGKLKGRFGCFVNSIFYKHFDFVFAVSDPVGDYLCKIGVKSTKIKIVENKIDFGSKKNTSFKYDFIQVGKFSKIKNQLFTLNIISHIDDGRVFTFAGDYNNEYGQRCLNYVKKNNLSKRVRFLGHINEEQLNSELSSHDYLLMPSLTEGFPLSPLEGFRYGLKAVISDNGGLKDIIKDKTLGFNLPLIVEEWVELLRNLKKNEHKDEVFEIAKQFYDIKINANLIEEFICEEK